MTARQRSPAWAASHLVLACGLLVNGACGTGQAPPPPAAPGPEVSTPAPGASPSATGAPPPAATLTSIAPTDTPRPERTPDVVYVATPQAVVDVMLEMARVGEDDVLYDLGSGDGRIPITAARRWGTRGIGIEIHPMRVREANLAAFNAGVHERVRFLVADMFEMDISEATVVTLYLLPDLNLRLRPKLLRLAPGTRIVTHNYHMGDWAPDAHRIVGDSVVYLWTVPDTLPPHLR
ncbi:class I SAM-dependent methyltransferase [Lysobacter sp. SG-8]|uniref:Class I SAM-dependent methyltransferase n=1 Tax=Marilutibacter penaei TaxID=2759900 RepID=A0A7W3U5T3_9GAMM|nr:class I SAM-dependent methyltransferase [Lysobacter penaei]MBB1089140.1 class I SAM-dependent methyltransferase [Lysobacter penaei]